MVSNSFLTKLLEQDKMADYNITFLGESPSDREKEHSIGFGDKSKAEQSVPASFG